MNWFRRSLTILIVASALTSCASFKNSHTEPAFCSTSAFIDADAHKPVAPETGGQAEQKKVMAKNIVNGQIVVTAYKFLLECWENYHGEQDVKGKRDSN